VFLAWSSDDKVARWLDRAQPALTAAEIEHHRHTLEAVRGRGYSIGLESPARQGFGQALVEERGSVADLLAALGRVPYQVEALVAQATYDVTMIAAPIFDANGAVVAALTVVGFAPGLPAAGITRVGDVVRNAAVVITKQAHGRLPSSWMADRAVARS
jgi:DNA-binding IclR family transcriptional regulator